MSHHYESQESKIYINFKNKASNYGTLRSSSNGMKTMIIIGFIIHSIISSVVSLDPIAVIKTDPLGLDANRLIDTLKPYHDIYPDAYLDPVSFLKGAIDL